MPTLKLTDRAVASAKPGESGRLELWDTDLRGLFLRVSGASKVWGFRHRRPDGTQPRIRLGHYVSPEHAAGDPAALTVAGARAKARKLRTAVDDGGDPASERRLAKAEAAAQPIRTIDDMAEAYFAVSESGEWRPRRKAKRPGTSKLERYFWATYLKPTLGDIRVEALTRDAVKKLLRELVARGRGVTANRCKSLLRQIYAWGMAEGRVDKNPAAEFDALVVEAPRERTLSDAEIKTLWAALKDSTGLVVPRADGKALPVQIGRPVRIALQLALLTMQRRGEIAGMRVDELSLDKRVWTLGAARTKAGRKNVVPLSETAVALVREALALRTEPPEGQPPSPFVFPAKRDPFNAPIDASALSHAFRELRAALSIPGATVHDCRRTGATLLASDRARVSPFIIGLLLNHAGDRGGAAAITLDVYVRSDWMSEKARAVQALERLLLVVVGERDADEDVVRMVA
jgi:integrase